MRTSKFTDENNFRCLEDLQETSSELSLIHFGTEKCKPYHVFAGERDEYIIHLIIAGHGFYSADNSTWTLSGGQMFLIRPGRPIIYCADSRDPWQYVWIGFKGDRAQAILSECGFTKHRLVLPSPAPSEYLAILEEMFDHITLRYADVLFRESSLYRILSLLCQNAANLSAESNIDLEREGANSYVTQAVDYIRYHYMHNITVSDVASQIGISGTYLNRLFKQTYNLPAQEFLMDFRMRRAAYLLVNTTQPVKEISQNVGYRDPLVFSKAFKKRFDVSPQNYRLYKQDLEVRDKRPAESGEE